MIEINNKFNINDMVIFEKNTWVCLGIIIGIQAEIKDDENNIVYTITDLYHCANYTEEEEKIVLAITSSLVSNEFFDLIDDYSSKRKK